MSRKSIGSIAVIFGGLLLALELYCLKFITILNISFGLSGNPSALDNLKEPNITISIFIICVIIVMGFVLIVTDEIKKWYK